MKSNPAEPGGGDDPRRLSPPDNVPTGTAPEGARRLGSRFAVTWAFLLGSALIGVALRLQLVRPIPGLNFGHLLHTHSHVAFLGWVFNAFFIGALRHFIPAESARSYDRLWWTMQIGVAGMIATFPFQGYAAASITFATVHTGASVIFAVKLWRGNHATGAARGHLRAALGFMVLSGVGPLALGPLAALGMRESPLYTLSIYFYLHCQYNGWFLFFLQALVLQRRHEAGYPPDEYASIRAARWLIAGGILTFALSVLWTLPPVWVRGAAVLGGLAQLAGCFELARALRGGAIFPAGPRPLEIVVIGSFLLKHALQLLASLPGLSALATDRFVAIAFLHLIFLGVVTPALIAWALENRWLPAGRRLRPALGLFLAGFGLTEMLLIAPTVAAWMDWPLHLPIPLPHALLASSLLILLGLAALGRPGERTSPVPAVRN